MFHGYQWVVLKIMINNKYLIADILVEWRFACLFIKKIFGVIKVAWDYMTIFLHTLRSWLETFLEII